MEIRKVGVLGCGLMGAGIAQTAASCLELTRFLVTWVGAAPDALEVAVGCLRIATSGVLT